MIVAVMFLLCLFLSFFSYGIPLVIFFIVKFILDTISLEVIKLSVIDDYKHNGNKPTQISKINNAAIRRFFKKSSSTSNGYRHVNFGKGIFAGYIKVKEIDEEVIAVIVRTGGNREVVISCFTTPIRFGNDAMSLLVKAEYFEAVISSITGGTGLMEFEEKYGY